MNVTCKSILTLPYANQLRLVAGKEGLNNEIRWVHYLEEPRYVEWLKGGELIVITGLVTLDQEESLVSLIMDLYEKNVAGVVISLSFYIEKISQRVIDTGNYLGLPIFEIPANIRIVDLSRSICFAIFEKNKVVAETEKIILDILYGRRLSEKRINSITNLGYKKNEQYRAVVILGDSKKVKTNKSTYFYEEEEGDYLLSLQEYLQNTFQEASTSFMTVIEDRLLWMVNKTISNEKLLTLWSDISENLADISWSIGVGIVFNDLRELKNSFECAEKAIEFGMKKDVEGERVFFYDEMIDLRLFSYVENSKELKKMSRAVLGELLEAENEELLELLHTYIQNDCNAKKTADSLYMHLNTFYYRLGKIEKILNRKLSTSEDLFIVMLAIKMEKINM